MASGLAKKLNLKDGMKVHVVGGEALRRRTKTKDAAGLKTNMVCHGGLFHLF